MYQRQSLTTRRLTTAFYRTGEGNSRKLMLLHGNVSSSDFYLPLFPILEQVFDVVAPDLRCFGATDALPVDARRGFRDWTDDLFELTQALGWDRFTLGGWSMGGCVAMQYAIDHPAQLAGLILINPGSPYGFGGTRGADGVMLDPPGLGSGGGCANPQLIQALVSGEREFLRTTLNGVYFKPPFRMAPEWEERFLDSMLTTKVGEGMYPGDARQVPQWPGVAAGDQGICNTMAPQHGNLTALTDIDPKPPVLWVRETATLWSATIPCAISASWARPAWCPAGRERRFIRLSPWWPRPDMCCGSTERRAETGRSWCCPAATAAIWKIRRPLPQR